MLGRRLRIYVALPLVLAAFAAQAYDSAPQLHNFNKYLGPVSDTWTTPLVSPFWQRAADAGITRIRVIPIQNPGVDWKPLGYFAVTHGMAIDSAYLGRTDLAELAELRAHEAQVLASGDFDPHTLYVLDPSSALTAGAHVGPDDLLALIDERIILVKGGAHLVDGLGIDPHLVASAAPPVLYWAPWFA